MKLRKLLSLILAAAMLLGCMCITAFADTAVSGTADLDGDKNASKDIEQNYDFKQTGETIYKDVTKVKLEWTITDIEATYESLKTWDPDKLQWTESKKNINAAGGGASFTITNYSSRAVYAKAEFAVEDSLKETFAEPAYTNNECTVATPVVQDATTTYKDADFTEKAQNITVALKLNKDKFAGLSAAASATKYGTYTITISVIKETQPSPAAPTVYYKTEYSVVLNENAEGKTAVKYGCSQTNDASSVTNWQDSVEFTGLTENTTYYFFAEYISDDKYQEAISSGMEATTYPKYLAFVSDAPFTLGMSSDEARHYASGLTVSTNAKDANASWTAFKYDGSAPSVAAVQDTDGKYYVYLRGSGMEKLSDGGHMVTDCTTLTFTNGSSANKIDCIGNIMTLLDYNDSANVKMGKGAFSYLFYSCSLLRSADVVASKTLASNCYQYMFSGCTSLTEAPVLPAETMAEWCYSDMFSGCKSLTKAPELPAEDLAEYCYRDMFYGCESLTEAPELPAMKLAERCYFQMFATCLSLTKAPSLPATQLAESCYYKMFESDLSLKEVPALLPATELKAYCYEEMFVSCISLTKAPALPATKLATGCYRSMFNGCGALTEAPELPATQLAEDCYAYMFDGCTKLTEAPELRATQLATGCYRFMFCNCGALTETPELPATQLAEDCYSNMFYSCQGLTSSPAITVEKVADGCLTSMFSATSLKITDTKPSEGTEGVDYGIILLIKDADHYNVYNNADSMFAYTLNEIEPSAGVIYYWNK